ALFVYPVADQQERDGRMRCLHSAVGLDQVIQALTGPQAAHVDKGAAVQAEATAPFLPPRGVDGARPAIVVAINRLRDRTAALRRVRAPWRRRPSEKGRAWRSLSTASGCSSYRNLAARGRPCARRRRVRPG